MNDDSVNLGNWRESPHSRWSFQHVDRLIPIARVSKSTSRRTYENTQNALAPIRVDYQGKNLDLNEFCLATDTDALCVLHGGKLLHEWYAGHYSLQNPHIVFSVSKSITATLAGVFVATGALQVDAPVSDYVPEIADSAYGDCTVQQVLDMTVSTGFIEDYTTLDGDYAQYRAATAWNPPIEGQANKGLHEFLTGIKTGDEPHGYRFAYRSPNSDLLGWIVERAGGKSLAELLTEHIWQPMGAQDDAYITVDHFGASRSAGGFCATPLDLLLFGELMRHGGMLEGNSIIPEDWVEDCINNGDSQAWQRGDFVEFLPNGRYRNQWYQTDNAHGAFFALGIHGQWIYIDRQADLVIVKLSSMSEPVDEAADLATLTMFEAIIESL